MTAWQPMETAPKDWTHVLLYCGPFEGDGFGWSKPVILSGYWDTQDNAWCSTTSTWTGPFLKPTHWMPLPEPPK